MTVDPRSDRAIYRQIADILRAQITDGTLQPGQMLPSEKQIADTYGVGRDAVRQAIGLLRVEGIAQTIKGRGTVVRDSKPQRMVPLTPGSTIMARMPTEEERADLSLDFGIPLLVVRPPVGEDATYRADDVYLVA